VQDREGTVGEEQWELSRFTPLLVQVLEDCAAGRLSSEEYPHVRQPALSGPSGANRESDFPSHDFFH